MGYAGCITKLLRPPHSSLRLLPSEEVNDVMKWVHTRLIIAGLPLRSEREEDSFYSVDSMLLSSSAPPSSFKYKKSIAIHSLFPQICSALLVIYATLMYLQPKKKEEEDKNEN